MTLEQFVNETDFAQNIIWVQHYGASREIESVDDLDSWSPKLLSLKVRQFKKHENERRGKNIIVLRFVGDKTNQG